MSPFLVLVVTVIIHYPNFLEFLLGSTRLNPETHVSDPGWGKNYNQESPTEVITFIRVVLEIITSTGGSHQEFTSGYNTVWLQNLDTVCYENTYIEGSQFPLPHKTWTMQHSEIHTHTHTYKYRRVSFAATGVSIAAETRLLIRCTSERKFTSSCLVQPSCGWLVRYN
jgi:hypothetical protein